MTASPSFTFSVVSSPLLLKDRLAYVSTAILPLPLTWVVKPILPQAGATPTPPEISALPVATSGSLAKVVVVLAYSKSPTAYAASLSVEAKDGGLLVPYSAILAIGDFVVIGEEEIR